MGGFFFLYVCNLHAGGHTKGGGNGGQYGDEDVQDFAPKLFVFHSCLVFTC